MIFYCPNSGRMSGRNVWQNVQQGYFIFPGLFRFFPGIFHYFPGFFVFFPGLFRRMSGRLSEQIVSAEMSGRMSGRGFSFFFRDILFFPGLFRFFPGIFHFFPGFFVFFPGLFRRMSGRLSDRLSRQKCLAECLAGGFRFFPGIFCFSRAFSFFSRRLSGRLNNNTSNMYFELTHLHTELKCLLLVKTDSSKEKTELSEPLSI